MLLNFYIITPFVTLNYPGFADFEISVLKLDEKLWLQNTVLCPTEESIRLERHKGYT